MENVNLNELKVHMAQRLWEKGITDQRVLEAMVIVQRHDFVPVTFQKIAYNDIIIPLFGGYRLLDPFLQAYILQSLKLKGDEKVLELGMGTGYQSALLAYLGHEVVSLEKYLDMALTAHLHLGHLRPRIKMIVKDPATGYDAEAPYDAIVSSLPFSEMPANLLPQLRLGGQMVVPVEQGDLKQIMLYVRTTEEPLKIPLAEFQTVNKSRENAAGTGSVSSNSEKTGDRADVSRGPSRTLDN